MRTLILLSIFFWRLSCSIALMPRINNTILVTGKVLDQDDSMPLEGAIVEVKGTNNITGTMPDGQFSVDVLPSDTALRISLKGYQSRNIRISSETYYEVQLEKSKDGLQEFLDKFPISNR